MVPIYPSYPFSIDKTGIRCCCWFLLLNPPLRLVYPTYHSFSISKCQRLHFTIYRSITFSLKISPDFSSPSFQVSPSSCSASSRTTAECPALAASSSALRPASSTAAALTPTAGSCSSRRTAARCPTWQARSRASRSLKSAMLGWNMIWDEEIMESMEWMHLFLGRNEDESDVCWHRKWWNGGENDDYSQIGMKWGGTTK